MEKCNVIDPVIEYYIVFTQGAHLISKVLRKNFSHIYLLTRDEYNWILLNPTRLYLQVVLPASDITQLPAEIIKPDDTVLKLTFKQRNSLTQYGYVGLLNCVTWTKYMLGLRVSSLTPWRLYKRLLRIQADARLRLRHGIISIEQLRGSSYDRSCHAMEQRA